MLGAQPPKDFKINISDSLLTHLGTSAMILYISTQIEEKAASRFTIFNCIINYNL